MKHSRLKNIINKSKELSNKPIGEFESFKDSLPNLIGDSYRLEAAWKAYGKPKDFKEAIWYGMILPTGDLEFKLPSIGYNEETDEYEYLNKGEDNETVAKDIRVWDNDVIPFVQELKLGGYVRTFNKEKDCWTYTRNSQKEEIESFLEGGKPTLKKEINFNELLKLVENSEANFAKRLKDPNRKYITYPDGSIGNFKMAWSEDETGTIVYPEILEINGQLVDLSQDREKAWKSAVDNKDYIYFPSNEAAELFTTQYKKYYPGFIPKAFKQGGSIIPEGSLHARKNNMEGGGTIHTAKGIPVMTADGKEQVAEIEKNEIIFQKSITDKIEELYKKYNEEESSSKKDDIAIEMGKILTCEIINNTEDRTGLIKEVESKL